MTIKVDFTKNNTKKSIPDEVVDYVDEKSGITFGRTYLKPKIYNLRYDCRTSD